MNSTPAASSARRSAWSLAAVSEVLFSVNSARRIVVTPTAECRARSSALQWTSARAALSCALVSAVAILTNSFRMILFIPYEMGHELRLISKRYFGPRRKRGRYETAGVENGSTGPPLLHRRLRRPHHHGRG